MTVDQPEVHHPRESVIVICPRREVNQLPCRALIQLRRLAALKGHNIGHVVGAHSNGTAVDRLVSKLLSSDMP